MALVERFFPVYRHSFNFFDRFAAEMEREFADMECGMGQMRRQMIQLMPRDQTRDVKELNVYPNVPIVEEKGQTKLKLEFDVHTFKPDEVVVKVVGDNILQIEAKHELKTDNSQSISTYFRQYQLPEGIDSDTLKPTLTQDGVLTIEAPAPPLKQKEKLVPIEFRKSGDATPTVK